MRVGPVETDWVPSLGGQLSRHHLSVSFTPGWAQLRSEGLGQGLRPWETERVRAGVVGLVSDGVDWDEEEDSRRKSAEVWPRAEGGEGSLHAEGDPSSKFNTITQTCQLPR